MVNIIILTHHSFGLSCCQIIEHFFGEIKPHYHIIGVENENSIAFITKQIEKILTQISREDGTIVLTDIIGATPFNILKSYKTDRKIILLTGLNVPMLVKTIEKDIHNDELDYFVEKICQAGKDGIMRFDLNKNKEST